MKQYSRSQFFLLFLLLAALSFFPAMEAAAQQRSWLEFFFPRYNQIGPDPSKTLKAPFAEDPANPVEGGEAELPENNVPLNLPHRSNSQISEWAVTAVSQALFYEGEGFETHLDAMDVYFSPNGKAQYLEFLEAAEILPVLKSGQYQILSFVRETPLLMNEGAVNERYRWLYEVPVMISYLPRGKIDYAREEPVNQALVVTVQIGRIDQDLNEDAVLIERWSAVQSAENSQN